MDTRVSRALRAEHRELLATLEPLTSLARSLEGLESGEVRDRLADVVTVLRACLIPHAAAEERVLYPTFERITARPGATATMAADHAEMLRRVELLSVTAQEFSAAAPSTSQRAVLQAELWGLWAILGLHLDKEEQLLFPELDQELDAAGAAALLRDLQVDAPVPDRLSPWEARLYEYLTQHLANEHFVLDAYTHLARLFDTSTYVGYLLQLVIDDERHHHKIFSELIHTLERTDQRDVGPVVPEIQPMPQSNELREATEQYLAFEQQDRRELNQLAKQLRQIPTSSLWPLLVEIMQRDTDKHIRILDFLRKHSTTPQPRTTPRRLRRRPE